MFAQNVDLHVTHTVKFTLIVTSQARFFPLPGKKAIVKNSEKEKNGKSKTKLKAQVNSYYFSIEFPKQFTYFSSFTVPIDSIESVEKSSKPFETNSHFFFIFLWLVQAIRFLRKSMATLYTSVASHWLWHKNHHESNLKINNISIDFNGRFTDVFQMINARRLRCSIELRGFSGNIKFKTFKQTV